MRSVTFIVLSLLPLNAACIDWSKSKSKTDPGEEIGTYAVAASLEESSCGEGALGMTKTWGFDVELSKDGDIVYWDAGGGVVEGELDEEQFSFESKVIIDMRQGAPEGFAPCSIERVDLASGRLASGEDPESFEGEMKFGFSATEGSNCADLVQGPNAILLTLPCKAKYALSAERTGSARDQ